MYIPKTLGSRKKFFERVTQECLESRQDRRGKYEEWRNFYLYGSASGRARFNKLYSHIEDVCSLLFSSETVRFAMSYGAHAERGPQWQLDTASEAFGDVWHDDSMGIKFDEVLPWSFVNGTIILMPRWRRHHGLRLYSVHPSNFGVYNESLSSLVDQEAVVMCYNVSVPEFLRMLPPGADEKDIMRRVSKRTQEEDQGPQQEVPVVLSNAGGASNYTGVVNRDLISDPYQPRTRASVIEMRELWVWDDEIADWRIIIQADPDVFIFDRKNTVSPGALGFAALTPNPLPDYFWGMSEIEFLSGLQYWRNKRFAQFDRLLQKAENPPKVMAGFQGVTEEKARGLNSPGATISSAMPGANVKELAPQIPQNTMQEIGQLDEMFEVQSGITRSLFGNNPPNVRSHSHATASAMLASARPKRRAMRIEGCLNNFASLSLSILRQEDETKYMNETDSQQKAEEMTFGELPESVKIKVDAHTASPIFAIQNEMVVSELFQAGAIDNMSLLELLNPPMVDTLKARLREKQKVMAANPQLAEQAAEDAKKRKKKHHA